MSETIKFSLKFTTEAYERFADLAGSADPDTQAHLLRKALATYELPNDHWDRGGEVVLRIAQEPSKIVERPAPPKRPSVRRPGRGC